ncbi:Polyphosphate kinase [Pirellula staleyi DSM 6068]|uniref:Polyphosphate kinase n=1 Tax=Pirellula staleyi (strain ATCC 27377 / DSM 6068 / ICPB 4128) TaxID=530564 RepID=D2QYQ1_PIRSD|nr:polyphosphate kinase 1 [Pirellula staleyi]ADB18210.1 Polyphosphate kinase [Pirellula staleyi DSM 6068]
MTQTHPRFFNRELSWLEFNQRVLDEARDDQIPLLERLKFIAITGSNLDEFFMVRVGGLRVLVNRGITTNDPSGMTPLAQLDSISVRAHQMMADQYECFLKELEPQLTAAGLRRVPGQELSERQAKAVEQVFDGEIFSVLTPMAIATCAEFPLLGNQTLSVCVQLAPSSDAPGKPRFAVIPLGKVLPRFLTLSAERGTAYVLLEDVVGRFVERFFPGEVVTGHAAFRITRNADFSLRDDLAPDLLAGMEDILLARKHGECVRLEVAACAGPELVAFLKESLAVEDRDVFFAPGPIDLSTLMQLTDLKGFEQHRYEPWPAQASPQVEPGASMFETLARRDLLLLHPYQSFEPVMRLIEEAAVDPDVLAIKQILYRTSRNSPIVTALARAAQRGKSVTAIVELKARFDEARNIEWARNLEEAGVQVVYGVKGLKTHAKTCIIVRREPQGIQRYVHFGTGNYNEITSRIYSDASLLTSNEELGADAVMFFNAITGYSQPQRYRKLEAAPIGLRTRLLELIEGETKRKLAGQKAAIDVKLNALVDPELIESLYSASQAGVPIRLNIRGVCCLVPGVPGLSENIRVVSVIDRFLEHARVLRFHHGGDNLVFISSADWMQRNIDRRIELLIPVEDVPCKTRLVAALETYFDDNVKARLLNPSGQYTLLKPQGRKKRRRSQELLYEDACQQVKQAEQSRRTTFEPHMAPGANS